MRIRLGVLLLALKLAVICMNGSLLGYSFLSPPMRWPDGRIVMHLQLWGTPSLIDGCRTWNCSAESALALWNPVLSGRVEFGVVRDSTAGIGLGNGVNNVFWSQDVYGSTFDEDALAVALSRTQGGVRIEGDVIFNTRWSWNSYRGVLRQAVGGGTLHDVRRVALHEFGHVLGLDHPDQAGQIVAAVMNSKTSNTDTLTTDDVNGARALYFSGVAPPPPPLPPTRVIVFPPRNESLAFRNALESVYRDRLGRQAGPSFVDIEGTVVWTQEYLRYRVNRCSHSEALERVFLQIDARGIQPVCGAAPAGQVLFPPRQETLQFRMQLETKYRDDLRRGAVSSFVDAEGDVVWTQEYLRYRVNACGHSQAEDKVLAQINRLGVQPVCGVAQ